MPDENENGQNPEDPRDALGEFLSAFGGKQEAEAFMEEAEMRVAWEGVHQLYQGLLMGGFTPGDAREMTISYLFRLLESGLGE